MNKLLKTISYLVACTVVFLVLVNLYKGQDGRGEIVNALKNQNTASIYFLDLNESGNTTCEANGVVMREVSDNRSVEREVVAFLLKGLTKEEVDRGFGSAINPKTAVNSFEIKNSTAYIDFNSSLNKNINDSCSATAVRSQIEKTLKSLPGVNDVVISINGQTF